MTLTILLASVSPAPSLGTVDSTRFEVTGQSIMVLNSLVFDATDAQAPALYEDRSELIDADDFLKRFASNDEIQRGLPDAREWLAKEVLTDQPMTLGKLRLLKKLSQKELAELVQEPQPSISRLESGNESPSLERASKHANALGVTLDVYAAALQETKQSIGAKNA